MQNTLKVRPAEGVQVRKEDGMPLPSNKASTVPNNTYYRRRLRDGDLVDVSKKAEAPAPADKPATGEQ